VIHVGENKQFLRRRVFPSCWTNSDLFYRHSRWSRCDQIDLRPLQRKQERAITKCPLGFQGDSGRNIHIESVYILRVVKRDKVPVERMKAHAAFRFVHLTGLFTYTDSHEGSGLERPMGRLREVLVAVALAADISRTAPHRSAVAKSPLNQHALCTTSTLKFTSYVMFSV
jgi:hypothetical protein